MKGRSSRVEGKWSEKRQNNCSVLVNPRKLSFILHFATVYPLKYLITPNFNFFFVVIFTGAVQIDLEDLYFGFHQVSIIICSFWQLIYDKKSAVIIPLSLSVSGSEGNISLEIFSLQISEFFFTPDIISCILALWKKNPGLSLTSFIQPTLQKRWKVYVFNFYAWNTSIRQESAVTEVLQQGG